MLSDSLGEPRSPLWYLKNSPTIFNNNVLHTYKHCNLVKKQLLLEPGGGQMKKKANYIE